VRVIARSGKRGHQFFLPRWTAVPQQRLLHHESDCQKGDKREKRTAGLPSPWRRGSESHSTGVLLPSAPRTFDSFCLLFNFLNIEPCFSRALSCGQIHNRPPNKLSFDFNCEALMNVNVDSLKQFVLTTLTNLGLKILGALALWIVGR
jgi:hypothetical protein